MNHPKPSPLLTAFFSVWGYLLRCMPYICPARHIIIGKYFYRVYIAS
jgi:hypothetical protein